MVGRLVALSASSGPISVGACLGPSCLQGRKLSPACLGSVSSGTLCSPLLLSQPLWALPSGNFPQPSPGLSCWGGGAAMLASADGQAKLGTGCEELSSSGRERVEGLASGPGYLRRLLPSQEGAAPPHPRREGPPEPPMSPRPAPPWADTTGLLQLPVGAGVGPVTPMRGSAWDRRGAGLRSLPGSSAQPQYVPT